MKNKSLKPKVSPAESHQPLDPHNTVKGAVTGQSSKPTNPNSSRESIDGEKTPGMPFGSKKSTNGLPLRPAASRKTLLLSEEDLRDDLRSWKINYDHIKA